MNPVRSLRDQAELTQAALASAGGTSQPAIAAYEAGRKSPTVATLQRLAEAAGLEVAVEYFPPMTREERRSIALHRMIADRLRQDPDEVLAMAREGLARMRRRADPASATLREWKVLLDRPIEALLPLLTDPDPWARELRHVTPFAGVLSAAERTEAYRLFAESERAAT